MCNHRVTDCSSLRRLLHLQFFTLLFWRQSHWIYFRLPAAFLFRHFAFVGLSTRILSHGHLLQIRSHSWLSSHLFGSNLVRGPDFPHPARSTLRPTLPQVQWVPGASFRRSGRSMVLTTHSILRRGLRKGRPIPLLPLWASVAGSEVKFTFTLPALKKS